jgi:EpsI family protein
MYKLVPVLIVLQLLLVRWVGGAERPPAPPDLAHFPVEFDGWRELHEDPIAADIAAELGADQMVSRTYVQPSTTLTAGLFVGWFRSQLGGNKQPHSPKVCLPAAGWTPETTGDLTIETAAGPIVVNRYLVRSRLERALVLYWYQTPRRVVAGEWASKIWLVADSIRDHRTDAAIVRIVVPLTAAQDPAVTATGFARLVYPIVRDYLPR